MPQIAAIDCFKHSNDFLFTITDEKLSIQNVNDLFQKTFMGTDACYTGKKFHEVTNMPESSLHEQLVRILTDNSQDAFSMEIKSTDCTGSVRWFRWEVQSIKNNTNKTTAIQFVGTDITNEKKAAEILLYQATLLNNLGEAVIGTDQHFIITSWNKAAEKIYGVPASFAIGSEISTFIDLEVCGLTHAQLREILINEGNWCGKILINVNTYSEKLVRVQVNTVYNSQGIPVGYVSVSQDVTEEHKKIENQKNQHHELTQAFDHIVNEVQDYAIIILDEQGFINNWNCGAEKIKGYTATEALGKNFKIFYTEQDNAAQLPEWMLSNARLHGRVVHEGWRVKKDGSKFWGLVTITALHDKNNQLKGFIKITRDLTEKRNNEIKLIEKEHRLRSIFNSTFQFMGLLSPNGTLLDVNKTMLEFTGIKREQVEGKLLWECRWWPQDNLLQNKIRKDIFDVQHKKWVRQKTAILDKNGEPTVIEFSLKPLYNQKGKVALLIYEARNVAREVRLQEQLQQMNQTRRNEIAKVIINAQEKEKEEISAELHDNVNQILASCRLMLEMCQQSSNQNTNLLISKVHTELQGAIEEIRNICRNLNAGPLKFLGLSIAINEVAALINHSQKARFTYKTNNKLEENTISQELKLAIFRIIQELVSNTMKYAHASDIDLYIARVKTGLLVRYKDNGIGINKDSARWGLGIRNIYNRTELFNGKIKMDTAVGEGFTISILFPVTT